MGTSHTIRPRALLLPGFSLAEKSVEIHICGAAGWPPPRPPLTNPVSLVFKPGLTLPLQFVRQDEAPLLSTICPQQ